MPWSCTSCGGAELLDDDACPRCGGRKAAWTVSDARTRHFRVHARARFEVLAGRSDEPGPAGSPAQTDREAAPATVAWSLARADAADLQRRGLLPAPAHQLIVRVHGARPGADLGVRVGVELTRREPVEQALATPPAAAAGDADVRLVLVHGPGPADLRFPGLEVVDVSDHGDPWVARAVRLSAAGSTAPRELPVRPLLAPPRAKRFELFAGSGDAPTAPDHPRQRERAGSPTATAWTVPRSVVSQLLGLNGRPAPAHQLTVRAFARPGERLDLVVAVEGGAERALPEPAVVEGGPSGDDVRLLFVHGDGPLPVVPGIHVIDVAAPGAPGHAPAVTLRALGQPARRVPLQATSAARGPLRFTVKYRHELHHHGLSKPDPLVVFTAVPHVTARATKGPPGVPLGSGLTDLRGQLDLGEVPAGSYELELSVDGGRTTGVLDVPSTDAELDLGDVTPTALAKNLEVGRRVMPIVRDELRSLNQWTLTSAKDKLQYAMDRLRLEAREKELAREQLVDCDPLDQPPTKVTAPCPQYGATHLRMRLAREYGIGNCGEKAAYAAIRCAEEGLHPVEVMHLDPARADHAFCVVGRAPRSPCHDARTWGPDAVIIDPWLDEVYAASEIADHMKHFASRLEGCVVPPTRHFVRIRL